MIPEAKLIPPSASITARKPTAGSERCGVRIAENNVGSGARPLSRVMTIHYTGIMPRNTTPRRPKTARKKVRSKSVAKVARGTARPVPRPRIAKRPKAWTPAEVEEAFRRFSAANPDPQGELKHINPYTLLVAVVLSAQATDAGVNKATPMLFAVADTPAKMVALGEEKLRDYIRTIGLFRTKARNVIALSLKLIAEHNGEVPNDRAALQALPGVGRKTANVVLNVAFSQPTIAVDTHIFRVANRTGLAPGKTPDEVEMELVRVVPPRYQLHAHHWLILHGRYTCLARRPRCDVCLISDLCRWPEKTV
jgi:endonuclease III